MAKKVAAQILIRYVGHNGRREIGTYVWSPENGHACAVDIATAIELLTYPRPDFELAQELDAAQAAALEKALESKAPVFVAETVAVPHLTNIAGLSLSRANELYEAGITSVDALAALDADGIEELSARVGANRQELTDWNIGAKRLLEAMNNG